jgi:hypothetical protein
MWIEYLLRGAVTYKGVVNLVEATHFHVASPKSNDMHKYWAIVSPSFYYKSENCADTLRVFETLKQFLAGYSGSIELDGLGFIKSLKNESGTYVKNEGLMSILGCRERYNTSFEGMVDGFKPLVSEDF